MIDEAPSLTSQPFERLSDQDIAPFKTVQTAQLVDALGGSGALAYNIKPLFADQRRTYGLRGGRRSGDGGLRQFKYCRTRNGWRRSR